ncbi:MAG: hypothetical protein IJQ95_05945 [Paludibacteraceae bacterium]|nr:hypothetical protein [Paludibacteraceae bacterium]
MAKVIPATPFESLSGKLSANEHIVMRVRNGKMHAYAIQNPYKGPLAESRKRAIASFAQAVTQAKTEMSNPDRLAYWQQQYAQYRAEISKHAPAQGTKTYSTLRGYIIAQLAKHADE